MSQTKRVSQASAGIKISLHQKAMQHVMNQRAHWSVAKITAFCKTCKNLPGLIDFNIKIEDAYQNFWKNDMRKVARFAKRFIELLKWITSEDHRPLIVLNFAYYDFALIQKIYTRFYHIESIVKRMEIAMCVIEIFQITPTLYSLNDVQRNHLQLIQLGIYRTWISFWSDDKSITFFNMQHINPKSLLNNNNNTKSDDNNSNIDDIDDLFIDNNDEFKDNENDLFCIDENENIDTKSKPKANNQLDDDDDVLTANMYIADDDNSGNNNNNNDKDDNDNNLSPHNDPIIRTINISDELSDINKQLGFISEIISWLKSQINTIFIKLNHNKYDSDIFNAIIICLRKLLSDASSITSLCVSKPINQQNDINPHDNKSQSHSSTSSYLRMIIDIVRDLTDQLCKSSSKSECIQLFKSVLIDVASNIHTHHLVKQLLELFVDRISNHQYKLDTVCQWNNAKKNDLKDNNDNKQNDDINNNNKLSPHNKMNKMKLINATVSSYKQNLYVFHIRILNCEYFVDNNKYGNDITSAYTDYLRECCDIIVNLLKKKKFNILYVLSSSSNSNDNNNTYSRLMISVSTSSVITHSDLELNTVISIVSDDIIQNVPDGAYRLNIRFYPLYYSCSHRYSNDFFYHRGISLRDDINLILNNNNNNNNNNKYNNNLMKSVLCLTFSKQATDLIIFRRFKLLKKLKDILISVHGLSAKYEIFGSMATKLDHINSDLDISIHLDKDKDGDKQKDINNQYYIRKILAPIYRKLLEIPRNTGCNDFNLVCKFLEHATVPIIKIYEVNSNIHSDISVCLNQSVIKTSLIKKYVSIDWRVKPLVLSIKHWVKSRGMDNTHRGDLNSFGFTLMIIHYLQVLLPPILPILYIPTNNTNNKPDWIQSDKYVNYGNKNVLNIGELFAGFFNYYHQKFNPEIHAISINKNNNKNIKNNFYGFLNKKLCKIQKNHNNILIVIDPLDNTDNIGRRVTQHTWNNMKNELMKASQISSGQ